MASASLTSLLHGRPPSFKRSSSGFVMAKGSCTANQRYGYRPLSGQAEAGKQNRGDAAAAAASSPALHRMLLSLSEPTVSSSGASLHSLLTRDLSRQQAADAATELNAAAAAAAASSASSSSHLVIAGVARFPLKRAVTDPFTRTADSLVPPSSSTPPPPPAAAPPSRSAIRVASSSHSPSHKRVRIVDSPTERDSTPVLNEDEDEEMMQSPAAAAAASPASPSQPEMSDDDVPTATRTRQRKQRAASKKAEEKEREEKEEKKAERPDGRSRTSKKRPSAVKGKTGPLEVSRNFVRHNLRRRTKSFSRAGGSGESLRRAAFRQKRGWKTKAEWRREREGRQQQVEDALYIELIDDTQPALARRQAAAEGAGAAENDACGYDTDDDLQALQALEAAQTQHRQSLSSRDVSTLTDGDLLSLLQHHFGFPSFRPFQLQSIRHILSSPSSASLLILPTAAGKSLCYLLPALLLRFTLVVSPLVSLMADQCAHLPPALPGACWTSSSTLPEVQQYAAGVRSGSLRLLFVSPEKATSPSFLSFLSSLPQPPSLLVVDEAHCISQWSHNFRPAFLHLQAVLSRCERVQAMTATATRESEDVMRRMLQRRPAQGDDAGLQVLRSGGMREELKVRMQRVAEGEKDRLVLSWLREWKLRERQRGFAGRSVIVYVQFREQAEQLAAFLSSHSLPAAAYHAGLPAHTRARIQSSFLSSSSSTSSSIIVATIAFGMGIDKADVGLVLHTSVPACLEMYAQEVGRAGRDGRESDAWACWSDEDEVRARSWLFRDGVERGRVRLLLRKITEDGGLRAETEKQKRGARDRADGGEEAGGRQGRYVPLQLEALKAQLQLTEEVALTLLTHLQLASDSPPLRIVHTQHDTAHVSFTRSYKEVQAMAGDAPLVQQLLASCTREGACEASVSLCDVSNALGWELVAVQRELLRLRAAGECAVRWDELSIIVQLQQDDAEAADADAAVELLMAKQAEHQQRGRLAVEIIIATMRAVAANTADAHQTLQAYFDAASPAAHAQLLQSLQSSRLTAGDTEPEMKGDEDAGCDAVAASVESFLGSVSEDEGGLLSSRAVCLILHGLHTLSSPQAVWGKSRWWGRWKRLDFAELEKTVDRVVTRWRQRGDEAADDEQQPQQQRQSRPKRRRQ